MVEKKQIKIFKIESKYDHHHYIVVVQPYNHHIPRIIIYDSSYSSRSLNEIYRNGGKK